MALVHLEDFLELVEQLPPDFKHSFAQLRSLDLRVQSSLEGRVGREGKMLRAQIPKPAGPRHAGRH